MICTRCQAPNPDVAQFCQNCAAPLVVQNPGYGAQFPGAYANYPQYQDKASGKAVASLIMSIASIVLCCVLLSVPGLIVGRMEMTAIQQGRSSQAGLKMATWGFYLGIAGTALSVLSWIVWFVVMMMSSR